MAFESDIEFKFGNLRLSRTLQFEKIKAYYKNSELHQLMINLWFMSKIEIKEAFADDILAQVELIKENWHENFVGVDYVIDHLVRNDASLMDLDLYNSDLENHNPQMIYDILLQPYRKSKKNAKLLEEDFSGGPPPKFNSLLVEAPKRVLQGQAPVAEHTPN